MSEDGQPQRSSFSSQSSCRPSDPTYNYPKDPFDPLPHSPNRHPLSSISSVSHSLHCYCLKCLIRDQQSRRCWGILWWCSGGSRMLSYRLSWSRVRNLSLQLVTMREVQLESDGIGEENTCIHRICPTWCTPFLYQVKFHYPKCRQIVYVPKIVRASSTLIMRPSWFMDTVARYDPVSYIYIAQSKEQ